MTNSKIGPYGARTYGVNVKHGLTADACVGAVIGGLGLAELRPLLLGQMAFIIGYSFIFSLLVNDFVKSILIARHQETPPVGA